LRDTVNRLFSEGGSELFTIALLGKESAPRAVQRDYALAVQDVLDSPAGATVPVGLLQAETGIGKSVGYLVPALLEAQRSGARVVVSTHTVALQNQIFGEVLPGVVEMVRAMTGTELAAAIRVGRRNFVSVPAFVRLADTYRSGPEARAETVALLDAMQGLLERDPASATVQLVQEVFARDIDEAGGLPFGLDKCAIGQEPGDTAGYEEMVAEAASADVLVVNHALLALDIMTGGRVLADDRDRQAIYVVDEADALPEVIRSLLSRKLPLSELNALVREMHAARPGKAAAFRRHVAGLAALFEEASSMAGKMVDGSSGQAAIMPVAQGVQAQWRLRLEQGVAGTLAAVRAALRDTGVTGALRADLDTVAYDLEAIGDALRTVNGGDRPLSMPAVYWTPARHSPGLLLSGGNPGMIVSNIWRKDSMRARALVLTSATLTGGGRDGAEDSMLDYAIGIGMSKTVLEGAVKGTFAPEGFGTMDFVVVDQASAPAITLFDGDAGDDQEPVASTNPAAVDWWVAMVRAAAAEDNGRILVLPLSYRDARSIRDALGEVPGFQVIFDDRSGGVIPAFRDNPRSILIAPGRWEGLDLPGMIRHIVIPRIPFSPPDVVQNTLFEAYLLEHRGMSRERLRRARFPTMLAKARRKIRQGIGRGIRRADDRVTVWIGDRRWPVPRDRVLAGTRVAQPKWAGGMAKAVPDRFRAALDNADGFTPGRGRHEVRIHDRHVA